MAELDLERLLPLIEAAVKRKINSGLARKLRKNILEVFRTRAKADILQAFIRVYDELAAQEKGEYGPLVVGKDPSALENFRHLFVQQIDRELDGIRIDGNSLIIEVGNKDLWGVGRSKEPNSGDAPQGDPQSVDFLGYYIEGFIGEFGFLTMDHYRLRRKKAKNIGRFGKGFLISKEAYEKEHWERITKIKFADIRHPISGQAPFKGFDLLASSFDFNPYIQEAVEKTFTDIGQSLSS